MTPEQMTKLAETRGYCLDQASAAAMEVAERIRQSEDKRLPDWQRKRCAEQETTWLKIASDWKRQADAIDDAMKELELLHTEVPGLIRTLSPWAYVKKPAAWMRLCELLSQLEANDAR